MIAGIDLAAKKNNPTGVCFFEDVNSYELLTLYEDYEIINSVNEKKATIIAIDAPLMKKIRIREADKALKKYGAMPPTMKGMKMLTERAMKLVTRLHGKIIEVFPTASAKILGIYDRDYKKMAEKLGIEARNKHEVDAYLAAYTAYLHTKGLTIAVGKEEKIIIPKKI